MALASHDNFYQLLGVTEAASFEEIRQSYHEVCRRFHPDKQAGGGRLTPEQLEYWSAIQSAWKCLSNESRRIIYDIKRSGRALSVEDKNRIQKLQRDQAARDLANMHIQYQQGLEREKQKNGIIVMRALFGDLRPAADAPLSRRAGDKENSTPSDQGDGSPTSREAESLSADIEREFGIVGPVIDVTVPIQCCVDNHRVILASGIGKSDLPGFYNPTAFHHSSSTECPSSPSSAKGAHPSSLYVLYKFKGVTHEVNVSETDALWLPLRSHAINNDKPLTGPAPPMAPPSPVNSTRGGERIQVPPTPMGMDQARRQLIPLHKENKVLFFFSSTTSALIAAVSVAGLAGIVGFFFMRRSSSRRF
jgi:curved DNA-binding protein CbpA